VGNIARRPNGQWRARYRDASGREHSKHFARKVDAQRWLDETQAAALTGQYVDPRAGRITLREYAEEWKARQIHRPTTVDHLEGVLSRHVFPSLGDRRLSSLLPSDIQAWVRRLSDSLAPSTVGVAHRILSGILKSAVTDRRIVTNPCTGTKLPQVTKRKIQPISASQLHGILEHVPDRHRGLIVVAAGTGMRQGELFGLTVDRLNFDERTVTVDRQLINVNGRQPFFAPPKSQASIRIIPLPDSVVDALHLHLRHYPTDSLVFRNTHGDPLRRSAFWTEWRRATRQAGLPDIRFHELRHYYASLLIRHGESVKTVQARLGHASASETLDTYSHLWPDSDERTRDAVDLVLRPAADYLRTAGQPQG
jgi:integrase